MGVFKDSGIYKGPGLYKTGVSGGGGGTIPTTVNINGNDYEVIKIGNLLWITSNLLGGSIHNGIEGFYDKQSVLNLNIDGWRVPKEDDFLFLDSTFKYQSLKGSKYWYSGWGGNNNSGFDVAACGYWTGSFLSSYQEKGQFPYYPTVDPTQLKAVSFDKSSMAFGNAFGDNSQLTVRLCKDI